MFYGQRGIAIRLSHGHVCNCAAAWRSGLKVRGTMHCLLHLYTIRHSGTVFRSDGNQVPFAHYGSDLNHNESNRIFDESNRIFVDPRIMMAIIIRVSVRVKSGSGSTHFLCLA